MPKYKSASELRPGDLIIVNNYRRRYQAIVESAQRLRGQVRVSGIVCDRLRTPVQFNLSSQAEIQLV